MMHRISQNQTQREIIVYRERLANGDVEVLEKGGRSYVIPCHAWPADLDVYHDYGGEMGVVL